MTMHVYLVKDSNELVSHCNCQDAMITFPPQADCPWCGCGWLFTCIGCRKAFTFARGVVVNESWEATARRDLVNGRGREPEPEEVSRWVEAMQALLAEVEDGDQYVCLDGLIIPTETDRVTFEGWHARHDLDFVPQAAALTDPSIETDI